MINFLKNLFGPRAADDRLDQVLKNQKLMLDLQRRQQERLLRVELILLQKIKKPIDPV
jgi:hypothetical protein